MVKRFCAVRMKGWVQIRTAREAPIAKKSEATIMASLDLGRLFGYTGGRRHKVPYKLKHTIYKGGDVLATIKSRSFSRKAGFSVGNGKCVEIPAATMQLFVEKGKG